MLAKLSKNLQSQFTNYFFSTNRSLYFSPNAAYAFGTGNFTIEFWINSTAVTANGYIQSDINGTSTNNKWYVSYSGGALRFGTHATGGFTCTLLWPQSANKWHHVAITRNSGAIRFYVDGVQYTPSTSGSTAFSLSQNGVSLGVISSSVYSNSYFCNVRLSTTAVYTANFTPPSLNDPIQPLESTVLCAPLLEDIYDYSINNAVITSNGIIDRVTSSTITLGQIAREIVKVCIGQITSVDGLEVFQKETSYIINSVQPNWELIFPATITDKTNVFILRSRCVNTNKFKYARFMLKGTASNEAFVEAKGGLANVYSKVDFTTVSIEMNSCLSVNTTSGFSRNNTYYHASQEGFKPGTSDLYISASSRHLLMYSQYNASTNTVPLFAVMEFPENNISSSKNLIPALAYRGSGHALTESVMSRDTTSVTTPARNVCQIPDGYLVTSGKTAAIVSIFFSSTDAKILTLDFGTTFSESLKSEDRLPLGTPERNLISRDIIFYDTKNGHYFANATTLTDVYFIPQAAAYCPLEYVYTYNTKNFLCLPLSSAVVLVPME